MFNPERQLSADSSYSKDFSDVSRPVDYDRRHVRYLRFPTAEFTHGASARSQRGRQLSVKATSSDPPVNDIIQTRTAMDA